MSKTNVITSSAYDELPKDYLAGLKENWKTDILSGFVVFLIALPLCLGIAIASGVPPLSGIIAAAVGGIVVGLTSGSFVTINGPAAGLIVVILGAVETLGAGNLEAGYRPMLAAVVIGGVLLTVLGLLRAGRFSVFFPLSAVHGLLASIGLIIISKQIHVLLGVKPAAKEPLLLYAEIPHSLMNLNVPIAAIGALSLLLLILLNQPRLKALKKIPPPLWVAVVAAVIASAIGLPDKALVTLPDRFLDAITTPDFSQIGKGAFWGAVLTISLVQGIETLLSASAVDLLDKFKRKSNLNRDLSAVGIGTVISGMLGGLPMIAEIVRSSANIENGARTRWANVSHGIFILSFAALAPALLHFIPFTALAALLIFTGYRLGGPSHFINTYKVGKEQLFVFVTTIIVTLATDLLIGVMSGIVVNLLVNLYYGVSLKDLFRNPATLKETGTGDEKKYILAFNGGATFSNMVGIKSVFDKVPVKAQVTIDCSDVSYIDHTVMEFLHHFTKRYNALGGTAQVVGLEALQALSDHDLAGRVAKVANSRTVLEPNYSS